MVGADRCALVLHEATTVVFSGKTAQQILFRIRFRPRLTIILHRLLLRLQGTRFGRATIVSKLRINWPNQVAIGDNCILQEDVSFEYCHGTLRPGPSIRIGNRVFIGRHSEFNAKVGIAVGDDCLIASGCKFIDHDHGVSWHLPMNCQEGREGEIVLEADVWLGVNVVVLRGIRIGRGAIVGAGSVVTKSIPSYEIWAGVPARRIGERPRTEAQAAVSAV